MSRAQKWEMKDIFGAEHSKESFARNMMGRESNAILDYHIKRLYQQLNDTK